MLGKLEKQQFREDLFRHLDGLVVAPIAYCLHANQVFDYILAAQERISLSDIAVHFKANKGYMNVGLRVLASQGWLNYAVEEDEVFIATNEKSATAFSLMNLYQDVVDLLLMSGDFHRRKFELEPFQRMAKIIQQFEQHYGLDAALVNDKNSVAYQVLKHIEGHLVGPTAVHLGMGGMFHKYFMEASFSAEEYHQYPDSFRVILDFLSNLGWFTKHAENYAFTDKGLFFAKRASAYGVTVSYAPMFRKMKELLFGNPEVLWDRKISDPELHVDREMNVWGSGGAHAAYFKKVDEIIIHLFNQPLDEQPKGILDMGCGNGALLIHLFEVIEKQTLRGKHLDEYPLFLIGADYNKAALKVTRGNLIQADIWAKVVWGDISQPDQLQQDLKEQYNLALEDMLSVRSFLDHNRIWAEPELSLDAPSRSTGAFAYRGEYLSPNRVERNLKDHLAKWVPVIEKYGLIVIELHSIHPELTRENLGKTAATAYDATHGFSDQYILEVDAFLKVVSELGLKSDERYFSKFPNSDLATVSINYLIGK